MSGAPTAITPQARLRALAATATIGTDRFGGDQAAVDALLTEAATCGLHARAGWRPRVHTGSLAPCPPDDRPTAPAPAIARLHMLLAERDSGLIEEWAALAIAHGVRVDGATAPILLDWWARPQKRSEVAVAALGRQGEWLASLNPDWAPVAVRLQASVPPDAETQWQTGSSDERVELLRSVRRIDPARARAFVESTWQTDSAAERQRFLDVLQEHRSMADEPFFEAALDDRNKPVRHQAAIALARLPGSRLRQRLTAVARQFISVQPDGKLALHPPETYDPAWKREGIEERPPKGVGPRAWWLRQIVAASDLAIWTDASGLTLTPAAVLEALRGDDFEVDAVWGIFTAAELVSDPEWSAALARHMLRKPSPVQIDAITALLSSLTGADAARLLIEIVATDSLGTIERWVALAGGQRVTLGGIDQPAWSYDFSRDVMTILSNHTPNQSGGDAWRASQLVEAVSRHLDPRAIDVFERAVTRSFPQLKQETIALHVDRVRVRAEMRKEFAS